MFFFKTKIISCLATEARGLAIDAIKTANSGHLGLPLGCAEIGAALFGELLNFDAGNPCWINRDRFVLSAGHGSMFLYTWLHLAGYKISLDDIKNFRKTGSITNGHPEFDKSVGIECTTGPLGQGVANAVGIALSCKKQAAMFNTAKHKIFTNKVVCLCGDGCLQEGISSEACSLAGHWALDNLILILDSNSVTLDAALSKSQSENVKKRFEAYGFEVFKTNGNNVRSFIRTFNRAKYSKKKTPKLIIATTVIGCGVDAVAGTNKAHGAGGTKFISEAKQKLGLPDEEFFISEKTQKFFDDRKAECAKKYSAWSNVFNEWQNENPELFDILSKNNAVAIVQSLIDLPATKKENISTRAAAGEILQHIAKIDEFTVTGSADLSSSTGNYIADGGDFSAENFSGKNIFFGIREHAMAGISNGMSYEGVFRPSCSTFLTFSDYMRSAIRVAAMAKLSTIFILTHDSIAVGEDGPTHQPVETIASLRCIPNLDVIRPADYEETVGAWQLATDNENRPTALILSRQDLLVMQEINYTEKREGVQKGAYIAQNETEELKCIILSSGSELHLAVQAAKKFSGVRAVSMPCMEAFERQTEEYKDYVLPKSCTKRIAIEAGIATSWHKYVGQNGQIISVEQFGFSGQTKDLINHFGITQENLDKVVQATA